MVHVSIIRGALVVVIIAKELVTYATRRVESASAAAEHLWRAVRLIVVLRRSRIRHSSLIVPFLKRRPAAIVIHELLVATIWNANGWAMCCLYDTVSLVSCKVIPRGSVRKIYRQTCRLSSVSLRGCVLACASQNTS
jgi:hypothetical protein